MPTSSKKPSELAVPGWKIEEAVGRGAAGDVFRVTGSDGAMGALKIGVQGADTVAEEATLLEREYRRWAPALLDRGSIDGRPYFVAAWVDGVPLYERWSRETSASSERETLACIVAHGVGRALAELHELGLRHGDVKPANILIHPTAPVADSPAGRGATLIDFSLAAPLNQPLSGATPRYISPSPFLGPFSDAWALGIVLLEILEPGARAVGDPRSLLAPLNGREQRRSHVYEWVRALLGPREAGRPSMRWIADRAAEQLRLSRSSADDIAERELYVKRTHRAARARCGLLSENANGEPSVRSRDELTTLGKKRWIVDLVGPHAMAWALFDISEEALEDRLIDLCQTLSPLAFSENDIRGGRRSAREPIDESPLLLMRALSSPFPESAIVERVEALALSGKAEEELALEVGRALLRRGETARALMVLTSISPKNEQRTQAVALVRAEAMRRDGRAEDALNCLDRPFEGSNEPFAWGIRGRVEWDMGKMERALASAARANPAAAAEVSALVAYSRGSFEEGVRALAQVIESTTDPTERARLFGVHGMLLHGAGRAEEALASFERATSLAAIVGSLVDEASYLTGLAACTIDLGHFDAGKRSAERAALLWQRLGYPERGARALLSVAAACAASGHGVEAIAAARTAINESQAAGDLNAEAYAWMAVAESRAANDDETASAARKARDLLANAPADDRIRALARIVAFAPGDLDAKSVQDADAESSSVSSKVQWEYWGSRARAMRSGNAWGTSAAEIVQRVRALLSRSGSAAARMETLWEAAALARDGGDGESARMFESARALLRHQIVSHLAPESLDAFSALPWASEPQGNAAEWSPAQVSQIESLIRALGGRERLRPLLEQVLDALILWSGVDRGLLLMRAPNGTLVPRSARNLARRDLKGEQLHLSMGIAKKALESGEVVVATDAFSTLGDLHASVHALRLRSVLAIPLVVRGNALGVVYLDDRVKRGAFGEKELAWVKLVAAFAATAIGDARDQVLLRRAVRRAERLQKRTEAELEKAHVELSHSRTDDLRFSYAQIKGSSQPMADMLRVVDRVTLSDVPVLVVGESGTGKELIARAIHENGERKKKAFVGENCASVPEALLESTLFGHVKGAFTGAHSTRSGLFDVADGGTLFLDEIGEMSLGMQAKLLRVLQNGEVRRVGEERVHHVNVRIIAATHRDLRELAKQGKFRSDLLYRLDVVTVAVPPLYERPGDIPLLISHFLEKHGGGKKRRVSPAAMERLVRFRWPGNVRQLENEIRRAVVLAEGDITPDVLSPELLSDASRDQEGKGLRGKLDALERDLVNDALKKTRGNQTKAAELLGLSRFGLQKMMKRLKIDAI